MGCARSKPAAAAFWCGSRARLTPRCRRAGESFGVRTAFTLVEPDRAGLLAITGLVESVKLRVEIADVLPLADTARAHQPGESNRTTGKLVLKVHNGGHLRPGPPPRGWRRTEKPPVFALRDAVRGRGDARTRRLRRTSPNPSAWSD